MLLSVVIPTLNATDRLETILRAITRADIVAEVTIADGGSTDATREIAHRHGALIIEAPRGRGSQLAAGAAAASGDWLLFLHADTVPGEGWIEAVARFADDRANRHRAAFFRFALDDVAPAARRLERLVAWRCRFLGLPYGDQGLLIGRGFYDLVGGFRDLPLMEDVDMVRRIGRRRLVGLAAPGITSADRYRRDGYVRRPLRNLLCLTLYLLGIPPRLIVPIYR
jgi:rSAM/selenodomain-associated transferase 2